MSRPIEKANPLYVIDAVVADLRASGDTGHVENLLQARADIEQLISLSRVIDAEFRSDPMAVQCFDLGVITGWQQALANFRSVP